MGKPRYQDEDDLADDYVDVECPECDAALNVHFPRGRTSRRLRCPICAKAILVNKPPSPPNLVQLQ
jgi:ribosomal protein S27E